LDKTYTFFGKERAGKAKKFSERAKEKIEKAGGKAVVEE